MMGEKTVFILDMGGTFFINILEKKGGWGIDFFSVMVLGLLRIHCLGFVLSAPFSFPPSVALIRHTWAGNW